MILNNKYSQKPKFGFGILAIITAFLLSACQPMSFLSPVVQKPTVQRTPWVPPAPASTQEKIIQFDALLQSQQNFSIAVNTLKENQFSCDSFENGISAKMTRCQKEYNDQQTQKVCTDTIWLEHQSNVIKKSQKFFDCQQALF